MAVSYQGAGGIAYNNTAGNATISVDYPSGIAAGDLLVLFLGQKPDSSFPNGGTVTTPSGWDAQGARLAAGGYGTLAPTGDRANVNCRAYTTLATGLESGSLSVSLGQNGICWGQMLLFRRDANATWDIANADGADETGNSSLSVTYGSNPGLTSGDMVVQGWCQPTDVSTPSQFSAQAFSASGATFGAATEISEPDTSLGSDLGGMLCYASVSSGTATGAPSLSATAGGTTTNVVGGSVLVRLREVVNATLVSSDLVGAYDVAQYQSTKGTYSFDSGTIHADLSPLGAAGWFITDSAEAADSGISTTKALRSPLSPAANGDSWPVPSMNVTFVGSTNNFRIRYKIISPSGGDLFRVYEAAGSRILSDATAGVWQEFIYSQPAGDSSPAIRFLSDGTAGPDDHVLISTIDTGEVFSEPVNSDRTGGYSIITPVSQDRAGSYAVRAPVSADRAGSYAIKTPVNEDRAGAYAIKAPVSDDRGGAYSIIAAVAADRAGAYEFLSAVAQDRTGGYSTFEVVGSGATGAYGIAGLASSDRTGSYSITEAVSGDQAGAYNVLNTAGASRAGEYSISAAVASSSAGSYAIAATVSADQGGQWVVYNLAQQDRAGAYSILNTVGVDRVGGYSILGLATKDSAGAYSIASAIGADISGEWTILSLVANEIAQSYSILNVVGSALSGSYDFNDKAPVGAELAQGYSILSLVANSIAGGYAFTYHASADHTGGYGIKEVVGLNLHGAYGAKEPVWSAAPGAYSINGRVSSAHTGGWLIIQPLANEPPQFLAAKAQVQGVVGKARVAGLVGRVSRGGFTGSAKVARLDATAAPHVFTSTARKSS